VQIELLHSKRFIILKGYIFKDEDNIIVTGKVRRRSNAFGISGHVDIEILDTEGNITEKQSIPHYPRIVRRRGGEDASFSTVLKSIVAKNSVVRIAYHEQH
ncbi:MAG: hypothetical protein SV062_02715, partial [Thermodesulfobacteriota bacterium]|nr:hypothetical protein [Thermodesulfobacteriota bacterium]